MSLDRGQILEQRLKLFASIHRLAHTGFERKTIDSLSIHIVNSSRALYSYDRSALLDLDGGTKVVAVSDQSTVNQHSEYCSALRELVGLAGELTKPTILAADLFSDPDSERIKELLSLLSKNTLLVPVQLPGEHESSRLLWVIELGSQTQSDSAVQELGQLFFLLGERYGQAWAYLQALQDGQGMFRSLLSGIRGRRYLVILTVLAAIVLALLFLHVQLKTVSDFEVVPETPCVQYAPFSGAIDRLLVKPGSNVQKGQVILSYNIDEILFEKRLAEQRLEEVLTELDLAKTHSFERVELRGRAKVLDIRRRQEEQRITKWDWYLTNKDVKAASAGRLFLDAPSTMAGRRINAGERLFDILPTESNVAEIYVNERDATLLGSDQLSFTLFPDTRPTELLQGELLDCSPVPQWQAGLGYCYRVRVRIPAENGLTCGMRGIARVGGERVSLGYYFLRRILLWWRGV